MTTSSALWTIHYLNLDRNERRFTVEAASREAAVEQFEACLGRGVNLGAFDGRHVIIGVEKRR